jgi:hypothetical protein
MYASYDLLMRKAGVMGAGRGVPFLFGGHGTGGRLVGMTRGVVQGREAGPCPCLLLSAGGYGGVCLLIFDQAGLRYLGGAARG